MKRLIGICVHKLITTKDNTYFGNKFELILPILNPSRIFRLVLKTLLLPSSHLILSGLFSLFDWTTEHNPPVPKILVKAPHNETRPHSLQNESSVEISSSIWVGCLTILKRIREVITWSNELKVKKETGWPIWDLVREVLACVRLWAGRFWTSLFKLWPQRYLSKLITDVAHCKSRS